jgi:hypothetical protein
MATRYRRVEGKQPAVKVSFRDHARDGMASEEEFYPCSRKDETE